MKASKLEQNEAATKRWRTRLKRAVTMLDKLERQRKRLEKAAQIAARDDLAVAPEGAARPKPEPLAVTIMKTMIEPDALALPSFLDRTKTDPVAEQIREEQAETKRKKARGRIEKMKAKQRGALKKMPLTGRAALEAIRNG